MISYSKFFGTNSKSFHSNWSCRYDNDNQFDSAANLAGSCTENKYNFLAYNDLLDVFVSNLAFCRCLAATLA